MTTLQVVLVVAVGLIAIPLFLLGLFAPFILHLRSVSDRASGKEPPKK